MDSDQRKLLLFQCFMPLLAVTQCPNTLPQLTDAQLKLSCIPRDISMDAMLIIERFVILLYDRTGTCTDIDKAQQRLFVKRTNVKAIPPTRAALEQYVKRAIYQGRYVWGQSLIACPVLPSPTSWGWMKNADDFLSLSGLPYLRPLKPAMS